MILLGGMIYLVVRQSNYPNLQATEWFAAETAIIDVITVVAAVVTAILAYPTYLEWKAQK